MSGYSEQLRNVCQRCGSRMKYVGPSAPRSGGHHATVFYCPDCERKVLRG